MYNQPENILEKYDLNVEQITKGRGSYICKTSQGMKLLAAFGGSEERARFLWEYLAYLKNAGFPAEQLIPTAEGKLLAEDETGVRYLLKDMVPGNECSTRSREEMQSAVKLLADYHGYAASCPLDIPEYMNKTTENRALSFQKHIRELILVKNYVRTRKQKNEFEQKFARHFPYFIAQANEALHLLEREEQMDQGRLLGHGDFNQHNVLRTKGRYRLINFEHVTGDIAMADLANFLRKMMEKNSWSQELGQELISAYDSIRPLEEVQRRQLYIILLFPEKFWKIANHYSSSHKAWLCGRDLEKLDRVIAQEEARERFLNRLLSIS